MNRVKFNGTPVQRHLKELRAKLFQLTTEQIGKDQVDAAQLEQDCLKALAAFKQAYLFEMN